MLVDLDGLLDIDVLRATIEVLVARHDALRTVFRSGLDGPVRRVRPAGPVLVPVVDTDDADRDAAEHCREPFDLAEGPLFRAVLYRLAGQRHRLLFVAHHLVLDGWSVRVLLRELGVVYTALSAGDRPELPAAPSHADLPIPGARAADREFWLREFADPPAPLALPGLSDRPRTGKADRRTADVGPELTARVREIAARYRTTPFAVLLGVLACLAHRWSGQRDLVIGVPFGDRDRQATVDMVGLLVTTQALRVAVGPDMSFDEVVRRARRAVIGATAHRDMPFDALVHDLGLSGHDRNPLFRIWLNLLGAPAAPPAMTGLRTSLAEPPLPGALFDLGLYVIEHDDRLTVALVRDTAGMDGAHATEFLDQFVLLLAACCADPDAPIARHPLRTSTAALPEPAADLLAGLPPTPPLLTGLAGHAGTDRIAIREPAGTWTHHRLWTAAGGIADRLVKAGVGPGAVVPILTRRDAALVPAMLGTLLAGAAFAVLDADLPAGRLADLVDQVRPACGIAVTEPPAELHATCPQWIDVVGDGSHRPITDDPDGPAYVAFTSGTTGRPRAVLGRAAPVAHFLSWYTDRFGIGEADRVAMLSTPGHDPLLRDVFVPLWTGGTLCVPPPALLRSPIALLDWLAAERITVAHLTPPLCRLLGTAAGVAPALRLLLVGGDTLHPADVAGIAGWAPGAVVVNAYGTTETPQVVGYRTVAPGQPVTVGAAAPGAQLLVVNPTGLLAAVGELGRVVVRGPFLAEGYADGAPGGFAADPAPGHARFDTADLGRYRPDGTVELLGRADDQVKVRGFRVAPAEVDRWLRDLPGILDCATLARPGPDGERQLVCYVVPDPGHRAGWPDRVRARLRPRLPEYMLPADVLVVPEIPLNRNGKPDRAALAGAGSRSRPGSPDDGRRRAVRGPDCRRVAGSARHAADRPGPKLLRTGRQFPAHGARTGGAAPTAAARSADHRPVRASDGAATGRPSHPGRHAGRAGIPGGQCRRHRPGAPARPAGPAARRAGRAGPQPGRWKEHSTDERVQRENRRGRRAMSNGTRSDDLVAVIGLACRVPGARDATEFWRNLRDGVESVRFLTEDDLRVAGVAESRIADPQYVRVVAEAEDIDMLDAGLFGLTPREATNADPQIRMFLEICHSAVEHAGYDPLRVGVSTGVYGSMGGGSRYQQLYLGTGDHTLSSARMASSVLNMPDYLSTLVSYKFGFRGPSLTVHTACSSSLVTVHLAAQALRLGECDMAVAGGTDVVFPVGQGYQWDDGSPVSPDGHCRPFDARAHGTVFGSGAGAVVLKRLDDALADGDEILAVLRGTAVNNDGNTKVGFTAPGVPGQAAAVREAMLVAGVVPADISYVEAHSTGTPLGDPVEITALARAYESLAGGPPDLAERIPISSVKGNVGHLGHAAGITSLIKVVLCLVNEQRAGTANFTEANPQLKLDDTPFTVTGAALPWPRTDGRPRAAAVSALGFGGTNAHAVLEEGPARTRTATDGRPRVLVWSGRSAEAAAAYQERLAGHLTATGDTDFVDLTSTLQDGRTALPVRGAVVAADSAAALTALAEDKVLRSAAEAGGRRGVPDVAFLFPGQAAQQPAMALGLYGEQPAFTSALIACLDLFAEHGLALADPWRTADAAALADTRLAQPLLFAVEYALARMWLSWGIEPAVLLGHSVGELVAATVAGVFDLPAAVRLIAVRATAMAQTEPGGMVAVAADADRVLPLLPEGVTVAVVNGPRQTVLAGRADALAVAMESLRANGISGRELPVSHGFHSPLMAAAVPAFTAAFDGVALAEPTVPLVSGATGRLITVAEAKDPTFWADQIVAPVRFDRALDTLLAGDARLLVEVGPGQTVTSLCRSHPAFPAASATVVPTMPRNAGDPDRDQRAALSAAAEVWVAGRDLDWPALRGGAPGRRIPVPGYPYQRTRHWPKPVAPTASVPAPVTAAPDAPAAPFSTLSWVEQPLSPVDRTEFTGQDETAVVLLPDDDTAALPVTLTLQQAGYRPLLVRIGQSYQDSGRDVRIRLGRDEDVDRLLDGLAGCGVRPDLLVHALAVAPWDQPTGRDVDEQLDGTFHSLRALARWGVRHAADGTAPGLLVIACRSVDVTGVEPVDPVKAALHGAVRTLAEEAPELRCRLLDIADPVVENQLAAEIRHGADPVVALRGPGRWLRVERPLDVADAAPPIRRGGVYLLTGGTGGLGRSVAKALATTGLRPHLVLVSRSGLPDPVDGGAEDPAVTTARADIAELTQLGARVRVEACDVTDRRAVRRLVDRVKATAGPVSGVVHLAGVPGDGMLVVRDRADADAVLRPKVHGTLALAEVFATEPALDFYLAFSSRAAVGGLVGSGDYAAGNAFLDAHTRLLARAGVPARTVNWPAWRGVGMAVAGEPPLPSDAVAWHTIADPATDPVLDEHRAAGVAVMPGTGYLDLACRAFRATVGPADALVRLTDVVFREGLFCTEQRRVRVLFRPDGGGWRWEVELDRDDRR